MKIKTFSYSVLALLAVGQALAGEAAASAWGPVTNKVQMAISIVRPGTHFVRNFSVDGGTNGYQVPPVVEGEKSEIKVGQPFSMLGVVPIAASPLSARLRERFGRDQNG
jgi:hypothetical protein